MLQEGIFYAQHTRPPDNFAIMFLRVSEEVDSDRVGSILGELWGMYDDLKAGKVRDLPGITLPSGNLNVSIGFGPNAFQLEGVRRALPDRLSAQYRFRSVTPGGGNRLLRAGGLTYEEGLSKNPATEEIMLQFLGNTQLAVSRPMVETWKLLQHKVRPHEDSPPMQISAFFNGFHREDRRSWIDFHDGVSNPRKGKQRLDVVEIRESDTPNADKWTIGGSYMTYMRLPIRIETWNTLTRREQELLVGRDKVSGCPVIDIDNGDPVTVPGCPVHPTRQVTDVGNEHFREPPDGVPEIVQESHVQRSNHHRKEFDNPESLRIYRQGYEFAETTVNGLPRIGLNFVAFHDSPYRIRELLTRAGWLGGTNFGGNVTNSPKIIDVAAAGIYLLPPIVEDEPFPGASIFLDGF